MPQSNEPSYHNSDAPIHCQGNPSDNPSDRASEKPTIAVSACLLGVACRYDGGSKPSQAVCDFIKTHDVNVVRICPEAMGGLSVPHPAHEITYDAQGNRRVVDAQGNDSTKAFEGGARAACRSAQRKGCTHAILKAKSPSCGVGEVYDGTFSKTVVDGDGLAAELLRNAGIKLATEKDFDQVFKGDFD